MSNHYFLISILVVWLLIMTVAVSYNMSKHNNEENLCKAKKGIPVWTSANTMGCYRSDGTLIL